ncbi:poly(A) polymerase [Candidatus Phytoplasma solani]
MPNLKYQKKIQKAQKIIEILKKHNFEAFIVGGAVRDYLLNIETKEDIDITTNALPQEIKAIFQTNNHAYYGTIKIIFEQVTFEITTYRKEGTYLDHRHPSEIFFIQEVQKDVIRRDFTINALLMDQKGEILDFTNGKKDLESKILRTITNPYNSFKTDALRMIRAFYFQAKLNFKLENNTQKALQMKTHLLTQISLSKIYEYLQKIMTYPYWQTSFQTIIQTKAHLFFKAITKAIILFASLDNNTTKKLQIKKNLEESIFWSVALCLEPNIFSFWTVSGKKKKKYQLLKHLSSNLLQELAFNLFKYGLSNCLSAYKINYLLSNLSINNLFTKNINKIKKTYNNLPLKKMTDLQIDWQEILPKISNNSVLTIRQIKQALIKQVLSGKILNKKEKLMDFILNFITNNKNHKYQIVN